MPQSSLFNGQVGARTLRLLAFAAPVAFSFSTSAARTSASLPNPPLDRASWIWRAPDDEVIHVRATVVLDEAPAAAALSVTADNGYELFVNGTSIGFDVGAEGEVWSSVERYDITKALAPGRNVIGIRGTDLGGVRGLIAAVRVEFKTHAPLELVTDGRWRVSVKGSPRDYAHPEFIEGADWTNATVLGTMGVAPWGRLAFAGSTGGRRPASVHSAIALTQPAPGFIWPERIAFLGEDCSVYVRLRGDAWGVCFRVGDWSRAYTEFDLPCPSKIGRKLYSLIPALPGATPRLLLDAGRGAIGSPSVSYDGQSLYVAMALGDEKFFHIYRLPAKGGTAQRLTDGPFHDIDPAELPDGRIVFASTRIGTFEEYHNPPSRALFVMKADGSDIEPITFTPIFDNEPKVMADGRIAFIRTDNFFDRAKVETQLHVIRPDGTDGLTEMGADVGADYGVRLRAFGYGSPAPLPDGRLACISTRGNLLSAPGAGEALAQRLPGGLGDLAPLPDGRLLGTVLRPDGRQMNSDVIAVIDPRDNQVVSIFESRFGSVHSPVALEARPRPPVLADTVDRKMAGKPVATGFLFCQNVRFTKKTRADWEHIRAIRVLGARGLTVRSSHSHIVHAGHETVELGTVPLAPDGSFFIEVPADTPLALQAVDGEGRSELNEMSWIYVRPGERRSCLGCHHQRDATPSRQTRLAMALRTPPLKLLGQGDPHRFRGNNSGVTGLMDLQFERFRETASLNRHPDANPVATGPDEIRALVSQLQSQDEGLKISAAQRLAIFRDRLAAPALAQCLRDSSREVRVAAALALSACGTRDSIPALLQALEDPDAVVAAAGGLALGNLVGDVTPFNPFAERSPRLRQAETWRDWFKQHDWSRIEDTLIPRLRVQFLDSPRKAIVALGHIGGASARAALRAFVADEARRNPYPPFVNDNRTDQFTFGARSPLNPRTLQEAVRALGHLRDRDAVSLLAGLVASNQIPTTGNLFLAEAAIEALGRIGSAEAEGALLEALAGLKDYWEYVGWYSDHPALYACHSSPLHARLLEALDRLGSTRAGHLGPQLIRSVPTDPDRALFLCNDDYETLVGRIIRRSGRGEEWIETCLALLGDANAKTSPELRQALAATWPAWAGHPAPDNRAAQILSLLCRDSRHEPRIRAAYERYRAKPEDTIERPLGNPTWIPQRHWVLFYLGRSLGNLRDARSVEMLLASLQPALNEARHGRPEPSEPNIHFLQLEYTPCWRAAAAWALGRIGERRAAATLLATVRDLNNATDVRHAAAQALGEIADPSQLESLRQLARDYPEYSTRQALWRSCEQIGRAPPLAAQKRSF